MKRKRKKYSDTFKAKVALEAIRGEKTIAELAGQYELHSNLIAKWKKHMLANASSLFSRKSDKLEKENEKHEKELLKIIGEKERDINWLKKKCRQLGLL